MQVFKLIIGILFLSTLAALPTFSNSAESSEFTAFGPYKIGHDLKTINSETHENLKLPPADELPVSMEECFQVDSNVMKGVHLMFMHYVLSRIDVDDAYPGSWNDIKIGSPKAAVHRAYGNRIVVASAQYDPTGQYLTVLSRDQHFGVRFEIAGDRVSTFYLGTTEAISFVEGCA
jgi:hypothetical protein